MPLAGTEKLFQCQNVWKIQQEDLRTWEAAHHKYFVLLAELVPMVAHFRGVFLDLAADFGVWNMCLGGARRWGEPIMELLGEPPSCNSYTMSKVSRGQNTASSSSSPALLDGLSITDFNLWHFLFASMVTSIISVVRFFHYTVSRSSSASHVFKLFLPHNTSNIYHFLAPIVLINYLPCHSLLSVIHHMHASN